MKEGGEPTKLRRVPKSGNISIKRKPDYSANRAVQANGIRSMQVRRQRVHMALPSDFHEHLSEDARDYWNQLPYEEQNRMIQQCRGTDAVEVPITGYVGEHGISNTASSNYWGVG